jgi:cysteine desulfurase/selenocysteine lyase
MIYLDNAATTFPKPRETVQYLTDFVTTTGGNPGRSGHKASVDAARIIFETREKLTQLINGSDSKDTIFTQNGTESLNLAILGLLKEKDHVVTTSLEHNSVMRPLSFLQRTRGVKVSVVECTESGFLDPAQIGQALLDDTKAVIVNHGSNVIGTVQPIAEIRQAIGSTLLIVDACQTIGSTAIDVRGTGIDILCFSCHKSLYGIQGLGALCIREGIELTPLKFGGTGSASEHTEQPDFLPDRYECGTPNTPGIASLAGGLAFIEKIGLEEIVLKKTSLKMMLLRGLSELDGVTVYGDPWQIDNLPVISLTMAGTTPSDIGYELNKRGIYVRVGLHCSPVAHRTIGTFPSGTVRIAPGYFTTEEDIHLLLQALKEIAATVP